MVKKKHVTQQKSVVTNYEGFEIPQKQSGKRDRITFLLIAALQLIAVGIIARQLKAFGVLPSWVNTDLTTFFKFIPRNPYLVPPCGHLGTRNVLVISENIVFPDGVGPGAIHMKRTTIRQVLKQKIDSPMAITQLAETVENLGGQVLDVGSAVVSPGIVDLHVHLNEPGHVGWEGLMTGTAAAAAGGITTAVDMPINCKPSITDAGKARRKRGLIWSKAKVDVAQWGGLVPANARDAATLDGMLRMGVVGLKGFMSPSGMDDFDNVDRRDIEHALPVLMRHRKPLMLHAEVLSDTNGTCDAGCSPRSHATWLAMRPPKFEIDAARDIVAALHAVRRKHEELWANATQPDSAFGVHIAHLSSVEALPVFQQAQVEGLPITIEATPHHLLIDASEVPDGSTIHKCAPPLRDAENKHALRAAVAKGNIDTIGSDHSPVPARHRRMDEGNFLTAWGGMSGIQYLLPATNTVAREEGWTFEVLARILSERPARIAGLQHRKGAIRKGFDADLVIWHPYAAANTSAAASFAKHPESPYRDMRLQGRVQATFVQGAMAFQDGQHSWPLVSCGSALSVWHGK